MTIETTTSTSATGAQSEGLRAELRELTDRTLSPRARYGHLVLLLGASAMGVLVLSLLMTEPALPLRTQAAFGAMMIIALGWVAYAAWVLSRRRPLFQRHRVVAASMGTGFSAVFAAVTAAAAWLTGSAAAAMASALGAVFVGVGVVLFVRARGRRNALLERRDALMDALAAEA